MIHEREHIMLAGEIDHPVPIDAVANQRAGAVYRDAFGAGEYHEQLGLGMRKWLVRHRKRVVRSAESTARRLGARCKEHQKQFKAAAPPPLA